MNILKHISLASFTPEERTKHVAEINRQLSETISQTKLQSEPDNKIKINIPDFFTLLYYPGSAVGLINKSSHDIYYGYTYNGSQKGYYKYTISSNSSTGNGQGADSYTHHCMIIEVPIDDKTSYFYVPAITKFFKIGDVDHPLTTIFKAVGPRDNPPHFNDDKSGDIAPYLKDLGPGHMDEYFVGHSSLVFHNDHIEGVRSPGS